MALVYYAAKQLLINGEDYAVGDEISDLTEDQATRFLRRGLIVADLGTTGSSIVDQVINDPEALSALADALGVTLPG